MYYPLNYDAQASTHRARWESEIHRLQAEIRVADDARLEPEVRREKWGRLGGLARSVGRTVGTMRRAST